MDDRWKTAEAKTATFQVSAWPSSWIQNGIRDIQGTLHYLLRGEGSMRDVGERPPGARQPQEPRFTPQEQRAMKDFERETDRLEAELKKYWKAAVEIEQFLNKRGLHPDT